jgi:chlorobactene glucosyltransferase
VLLTIAAFVILAVVLSNVLFWPRVRVSAAVASAAGQPTVSVLIPARNEEQNIAACLQSVLRQGDQVREILIYDDHSVDRTGELAGQFASEDTRIRLVPAEPLPADWCGKNFACAQLAAAASSEWLLFLDADTRLAAGAVGAIRRAALQRNLTMLSCWPGLALVNFSERALMPMLNFVVFTIFPAVLSLFRFEPSLGIAHGACLFLHRETYHRLGGHAAVHDEIFEDTRLAQWWRQNHERSLCLDGQDVVSVRMYASFPEIWRGFQKNFFPAFRTKGLFWLFLIFHFTVFLAPFLIGNWSAMGLVLLARILLAMRFAQPWWSVLLHPLAEAVMLCLGVSSWWHCRSGRGVAWKGRVYLATRVPSRTGRT